MCVEKNVIYLGIAISCAFSHLLGVLEHVPSKKWRTSILNFNKSKSNISNDLDDYDHFASGFVLEVAVNHSWVGPWRGRVFNR